MFRFNGFTQKANNAINLAISAASQLGHTYIGSEHLLYGLQKEGSGVAYHLLFSLGVQGEDILSLLIDLPKTIQFGSAQKGALQVLQLSSAVRQEILGALGSFGQQCHLFSNPFCFRYKYIQNAARRRWEP